MWRTLCRTPGKPLDGEGEKRIFPSSADRRNLSTGFHDSTRLFAAGFHDFQASRTRFFTGRPDFPQTVYKWAEAPPKPF